MLALANSREYSNNTFRGIHVFSRLKVPAIFMGVQVGLFCANHVFNPFMTYHFHIILSGTFSPEVWRRVAVPSTFTFYKFHKVIQRAFGWKDYHLHQFIEFERFFHSSINIGIPDPEDLHHVHDGKKLKLDRVIPQLKKFKYIYDFGDLWEHVVVLEKTEASDLKRATLLGGEGACPPEDCGGPAQYEQVKLALANPNHEEHDNYRTWLGLKKKQNWDADYFDLKKASGNVEKI
jgi:hypothetical protein